VSQLEIQGFLRKYNNNKIMNLNQIRIVE